MSQKMRKMIQSLGVLLSLLLLAAGVRSFNLLFVAAALLLALVGGRFFCGWFCPVGFWADYVIPLFSRRRPLPPLLRRQRTAYIFTVLFIAAFVYLYLRAPLARTLLPFVLMGSVFLLVNLIGALTYPRAWCGYLCPWGTLAAILGRRACLNVIMGSACRHCRTCVKVCPIGLTAVTLEEHRKGEAAVLPPRCIRCFKCLDSCPQGALSYGSLPQEQQAARKTA